MSSWLPKTPGTLRTTGTWLFIGVVLLVGLAMRLCYLVARYSVGDTAVRRPHIESAALLLAIGIVSCRLATRPLPARDPGRTLIVPRTMWIVMCCLATVLYWPALFVGFLSDDFVLVQQSLNWRLGALSAEFFRPLPLIAWGVLLHIGSGSILLHLFNILLHGTNAYLAMRVIGGWLPQAWWMLAAGLMVLTAPLAPEAVVWCSGVFDLLATALILSSILIARRYDDGRTVVRRVLFIVIVFSAVLSKESGAIAPALVVLDAWLRRSLPRKLIQDLVIGGGAIVLFSVARLISTFGVTAPPISKFRLQRVLFDSFGSLAVPWHVDVLSAQPLVTFFSVVSLVCLLTAFGIVRGERSRTRTALGGGLWILVSLVPVFPIFFIAPDLQGSRYLYAGTVGWVVVIVTAAADLRAHQRWVGVLASGVVVLTIAAFSYGVRLHLQPWIHAAGVRDMVQRAAAVNTRMKACEVVKVRDLPDSVRGAYVFRVGAREVFAIVGLNAFVEPDNGPCSFRWDSRQSSFVEVSQ